MSETGTLAAQEAGDPARQDHSRAAAALFGLMAVWGLNVTVMKILADRFEPPTMALLRIGVAALGLVVLAGLVPRAWPRFTRAQCLTLLACGASMIYATQALVAAGLHLTTATHGALINALAPLVTSLLGAALLRERPTAAHLFGVALGFSGVAVVVAAREGLTWSSAGFGDLLLLASVLTFALGGLMVQRLARELDALQIACAIHVVGAALLVLHVLVSPARLDAASLMPGWQPWLLMLFSALISAALGGIVWGRSIARIGAARASTFLNWVPIFGVAFGALLLDEPLTWRHVLGLALVLAGTAFGQRRIRA